MTAATITQLPAQVQVPAPPAPQGVGQVRPIIPRTYQDVAQMAQAVCRAGIARKYDNDPSRVASIMMSGMELGLKPLASLRLFYMTPEGQPALSARGMLAVVQSSGLLEHYSDHTTGEGDERTAVVSLKRRGHAGIVRKFSMADAKKAGLLGKQNWSKYTDRMMWNRAVSFAMNDAFADLLGGLYEPSELGGPVLDDDGTEMLPPIEDKPQVAQIEVIMPAGDPLYFPKTSQGLEDMVRSITDTVLDGGAGVALLNVELLDRLAKAEDGKYAQAVQDIRDTAREMLTAGGELDAAEADDTQDEA